jgi:transcriptional regulator with XRE-family HTH domain
VALGYISEVERGRKDPSDGVLEALASGLDLSMTDFIGEVYTYLKEQDGEA